MFKSTSFRRAMDARVKQQYLEFMLVFASEFRNLPVHFGYRKAPVAAEGAGSSLTSTTTSDALASRAFVTQRFFLRLEPQHPGNAWIRSHGDLFDLVGPTCAETNTDNETETEKSDARASTTSSPSVATSRALREKVHVYTSYHRVKVAKTDSVGTPSTRSVDAVPTCYTYVFPAHELLFDHHMRSTTTHAMNASSSTSSLTSSLETESVLPPEVRWWRQVCGRVLDPLLPLHWENNQPWLISLHSHTHGGGDHARAQTEVAAPQTSALCSPEAMAKAVMDANNTLTFRARVQQRFFQNACLTPGGDEVKRALARGRLEIRQLKEIAHVRKFRAMRKRYEWSTVRLHGQGSEGTPEEQWWLGLENRDTYGYNELDAAASTRETGAATESPSK